MPKVWNEEMHWLVDYTKCKGLRAFILKLAAQKSICGIWSYQNDNFFGRSVVNTYLGEKIIDMIVYGGWYNGKIRKHR